MGQRAAGMKRATVLLENIEMDGVAGITGEGREQAGNEVKGRLLDNRS